MCISCTCTYFLFDLLAAKREANQRETQAKYHRQEQERNSKLNTSWRHDGQ